MSQKRSKLMARIKSKNTDPEKKLRSILWRKGLRYRIHFKTPAGKPDIVFPQKKIAVFIDGCFWHGCPEHYAFPRTRQEFWAKKLLDNVKRDQKQTDKLFSEGWTVVRVWEHEIYENIEKVVDKIIEIYNKGECHIDEGWRVESVAVPEEDLDLEKRKLVTLSSPNKEEFDVRKRSTKKWKRN